MSETLRPNETKAIGAEGFEHETRDCTVRAFSIASNIQYADVHAAFKTMGRKDKHRTKTKKVFQNVCKILKIKAKQVKRSGSVEKLLKEYPIGRLFCVKSGHAFVIVDGIVHDLDSTKSHIKGAWLMEEK